MPHDARKKSAAVAYAWLFFLGTAGAHRFYLGRPRSAAAMLVIFVASIPLVFTGIGAAGFTVVTIWAVVDAFLVPGMVDAYNSALIQSLT